MKIIRTFNCTNPRLPAGTGIHPDIARKGNFYLRRYENVLGQGLADAIEAMFPFGRWNLPDKTAKWVYPSVRQLDLLNHVKRIASVEFRLQLAFPHHFADLLTLQHFPLSFDDAAGRGKELAAICKHRELPSFLTIGETVPTNTPGTPKLAERFNLTDVEISSLQWRVAANILIDPNKGWMTRHKRGEATPLARLYAGESPGLKLHLLVTGRKADAISKKQLDLIGPYLAGITLSGRVPDHVKDWISRNRNPVSSGSPSAR